MGKVIDITGQRFNHLVAISYQGDGTWLFRCDCGEEYIGSSAPVRKGKVKACGCLHRAADKDLVGRRFGMLKVESYAGGSKWRCKCDCGKYTTVYGHSLHSGRTISCGCYNLSIRSKVGKLNVKLGKGAVVRTHGLSGSPEFNCWCRIKARCNNVNDAGYKDYGGRGIKVCERWQGEHGFENFLADMGERPSSNHSIDRIDVNGDYCPENCRWATVDEQANNKRNNVYIEYNGETKTLSEWAHYYNVSVSSALRKYHLGYNFERVFERRERNRRILSDEEVRAIRKLHLSAMGFQKAFGRKVSNGVLRQVKKYKTYKDVSDK